MLCWSLKTYIYIHSYYGPNMVVNSAVRSEASIMIFSSQAALTSRRYRACSYPPSAYVVMTLEVFRSHQYMTTPYWAECTPMVYHFGRAQLTYQLMEVGAGRHQSLWFDHIHHFPLFPRYHSWLVRTASEYLHSLLCQIIRNPTFTAPLKGKSFAGPKLCYSFGQMGHFWIHSLRPILVFGFGVWGTKYNERKPSWACGGYSGRCISIKTITRFAIAVMCCDDLPSNRVYWQPDLSHTGNHAGELTSCSWFISVMAIGAFCNH